MVALQYIALPRDLLLHTQFKSKRLTESVDIPAMLYDNDGVTSLYLQPFHSRGAPNVLPNIRLRHAPRRLSIHQV